MQKEKKSKNLMRKKKVTRNTNDTNVFIAVLFSIENAKKRSVNRCM